MKALLISVLAVGLGAATSLSAGPANAVPRERDAAATAALVAKADPATRTTGRIHVDQGTIAAGEVTVRIGNTATPETVSGAQVVSGSGADYVARSIDGGLQIAAVVDKPSDLTQSYQFAGRDLKLLPSGWVIVRDRPTGRAVALIAAPWAVDSSGARLSTAFTVKGDTLTQTTTATSRTVYPVVADPVVSWGLLSVAVTFTKSETKSIASKTGYAATAAAVCAIFPIPVAVGCGALMAIWATMLDKTFNEAVSAGKCVKMDIPYTAVLIPTATLSKVKCP